MFADIIDEVSEAFDTDGVDLFDIDSWF